ncbi:MAG: transglutaminase-like domain-containing protein [Bacteriovoracaceae bacterium]
MKWPLFIFVFVPFLSFASGPSQDRDWNLTVTAKGSLSSGEKFESIGVATFASLDTLLLPKGGFETAYRPFQAESHITYGVWQEAEAFSAYLKDCGIDAPADVLAMKLGLKKVFATANDQELNDVYAELGSHLTFEKKIEFASRIGGVLMNGYDYERAGGSHESGIVTMRDMINAHNNKTDAGVCRDMAVAQSQALKQMGVKDSYVMAFETVGDGHATVIAQDPDDPAKTYNINYNYVTSTQSGDALSHLQNDSTIPSVGTNMRLYDADGHPLTVLPTNLGVALHEIMGGNASDMDPMLRSATDTVSVQYSKKGPVAIGAGASVTPDGDKVIGLTATYKSESEHFPGTFSVVVYNDERDTNIRGHLSTTGVYLEGVQHVISDPITVKTSAGTASVNFEGRINLSNNFSYSRLSVYSEKGFSADNDISAGAGVHARFASSNGGTNFNTSVMVDGGVAKRDVRDEGSTTFDLRDVTATAVVSQRVSSHLQGFVSGAVVDRKSLGVTAREEAGLRLTHANGSQTSVVVGHEGSVSGKTPAFVPGSIRQLYADIEHRNEAYGVGGGGFCRWLTDNKKECGLRTSATIKFGGPHRD